jgi:hypothetical protein
MSENGFFQVSRKLSRHPDFLSLSPIYQMILIRILDHLCYEKMTLNDHGIEINLDPGQLMATCAQIASWCNCRRDEVHRAVSCYTKLKILRQEVLHTKMIITLLPEYIYTKENTLSATEFATRLRQDCDINNNKEIINNNGDSENPKSASIKFSFEERKFLNISEIDIFEWNQLFPNVNLESEFRIMEQWCLNNQAKSKKRSLWRKFITNWLTTAQERAINKLKTEESHKGTTHESL